MEWPDAWVSTGTMRVGGRSLKIEWYMELMDFTPHNRLSLRPAALLVMKNNNFHFISDYKTNQFKI
jgi:hypothetical protein